MQSARMCICTHADRSHGVVPGIIYISGIIFLFFHVNKWYIFSAYSTYSFTVHFSLDLNNYKWTFFNTQRRNSNVSLLQSSFLSAARTPIHTHMHTTRTIFSHLHSYLPHLPLFSFFCSFVRAFALKLQIYSSYRAVSSSCCAFLVYFINAYMSRSIFPVQHKNQKLANFYDHVNKSPKCVALPGSAIIRLTRSFTIYNIYIYSIYI